MEIVNITFEAEGIVSVSPLNYHKVLVSADHANGTEILDHFKVSHILDHCADSKILDEIGIDRVKEYFDLTDNT
jgi:hypothetical protein